MRGCGADYNKADREATVRLAERQCLERSIRRSEGPLGNAIIGVACRACVGLSARPLARSSRAATGATMQKVGKRGGVGPRISSRHSAKPRQMQSGSKVSEIMSPIIWRSQACLIKGIDFRCHGIKMEN